MANDSASDVREEGMHLSPKYPCYVGQYHGAYKDRRTHSYTVNDGWRVDSSGYRADE